MNKENVEKYLLCVKCRHNLAVEYYNSNEGLLCCSFCKTKYPIIKNIPRLLTGKLLKNCYYFYYETIQNDKILKEYFNKTIFNENKIDKSEIIKSDTQKQFSYEWNIWKKLPAFAENHFLEVVAKPSVFFNGKTGWDPAVGMGRDLFNAAIATGKTGFIIGSDLSFAVDVAHERCRDLNNVLIVQADLYSNFLADNSLDFAYMIGLIQHLTDPQKGIEQVFRKIRKGGYFVGTVYAKTGDWLNSFFISFIGLMRILTLNLPLNAVLYISYLCAIPAYLFFKLPSFVLDKLQYTKDMVEVYPTHLTQKRKPNLNLLALNWFDHFTPPVIGFYNEEEIKKLIENIFLDEKELKYGIFKGYKK